MKATAKILRLDDARRYEKELVFQKDNLDYKYARLLLDGPVICGAWGLAFRVGDAERKSDFFHSLEEKGFVKRIGFFTRSYCAMNIANSNGDIILYKS